LVVIAHSSLRTLKLTKKHLHIYDLYEGKRTSLENVGTPEEKELFRNGEFKKISNLIDTKFKANQGQLSNDEITKYKLELDQLFDKNWNKKSIKYLSTKYCEPRKTRSSFNKIMDMLWAMFG